MANAAVAVVVVAALVVVAAAVFVVFAVVGFDSADAVPCVHLQWQPRTRPPLWR